MRLSGPSNPFHLARAYGIAPPQRADTPHAHSHQTSQGAADVSGEGPSDAKVRMSRIIAGTVPGGISFDDAGDARPTRSESIPLYRRPGEQNAVATRLSSQRSIGGTIDLRG